MKYLLRLLNGSSTSRKYVIKINNNVNKLQFPVISSSKLLDITMIHSETVHWAWFMHHRNDRDKMLEATAKLFRKCRKRKAKLKSTFDVLRPINILCNTIGIRVIEYPRGQPREKLSFLYLMFLLSLFYGGWYSLKKSFNASKMFNVQEAIYTIANGINQIGMCVIVLVGYYRSKSMKLSVRKIHEIDVTLQALGSSACFNGIYNSTIAMISYAILYEIVYLTAHILTHMILEDGTLKILTMSFVSIYIEAVEFLLIIEFVTMISCIQSEFRRANDLLSDINILPLSSIAIELLDKESSNLFSVNKSSFASSTKLLTVLPCSERLRSNLQKTSHERIRIRRLLQTIRQIHLELYRVSKNIGTMYGIQISMEMGLCVLYTTYYLYNLYNRYHNDTSFILLLETVGTFLMCFNNAIKIISVNYICESTSREAERTNEIIYTFYGHNKDYEMQEEMEIFSLQMMQCQPTFSAFGLYSLNCKNICSCIGIITTYVVIMIQVTDSITDDIS